MLLVSQYKRSEGRLLYHEVLIMLTDYLIRAHSDIRRKGVDGPSLHRPRCQRARLSEFPSCPNFQAF